MGIHEKIVLPDFYCERKPDRVILSIRNSCFDLCHKIIQGAALAAVKTVHGETARQAAGSHNPNILFPSLTSIALIPLICIRELLMVKVSSTRPSNEMLQPDEFVISIMYLRLNLV